MLKYSVSSARRLGCGHFSGYVCHSARQQVRNCLWEEKSGEKVHPHVLYFTVGMGKACLAATKWIPVWFCHVEKMVAPIQRKERTAAVGTCCLKGHGRRQKTFLHSIPLFLEESLEPDTTLAVIHCLTCRTVYFCQVKPHHLLTLPFLGEATSCQAVLHS